jgi:hypothetical protein
MMVSIHTTSKEYNASYREITPIVYDFVIGCNHGYTFRVTFCSRVRLSFPELVLPTQGTRTLGHIQIHMR